MERIDSDEAQQENSCKEQQFKLKKQQQKKIGIIVINIIQLFVAFFTENLLKMNLP